MNICCECSDPVYRDRNRCHLHHKKHRRELHKKRGGDYQWEYKMRNRQRVNLLEWFRRKGIKRADLNNKDFEDLLEMKEAINLANNELKQR